MPNFQIGFLCETRINKLIVQHFKVTDFSAILLISSYFSYVELTLITLRELNFLISMTHKEDLGDKWFEDLYINYSRELFWIAMAYSNNKILAEDAVQEAFLYLWKNRKKFNNTEELRPYLNLVVRNHITDFFRHRQIREKHHPIIQEETLEREYNPEEDDFEEKFEAATKLINTLPEGCRKVFVAAVIEGMTYQQIADQLAISKNTVKTQLKIAYKKLQSKDPKLYLLIFILLKSQFFTPFF